MNTGLKFTDKDVSELKYLLHNAPINISHRNKEIIPMNGYWYTSIDGKMTDNTFEEFHDAVCWLLNPFWEEVNGHPYT
jgi:hypothetical protein